MALRAGVCTYSDRGALQSGRLPHHPERSRRDNMKALLALGLAAGLIGCAQAPSTPAGVYILSTADMSIVLDVRAGGDYVLQTSGPGRNTDEIRGSWREASGPALSVSFSGIVWRGIEPEAGEGTWSATIDSDAQICLDGEGLHCFFRNDVS